MKSDISLPSYELMGKRVVCIEVQATRLFSLETDLDHWIAKNMRKHSWSYTKIDTVNQVGMPDALLLKGSDYFLIESKLLKRARLTNLLDNLRWQPGQIPWLLKALKNKERYLLAIAKNKTVMFVGSKETIERIHPYLQR